MKNLKTPRKIGVPKSYEDFKSLNESHPSSYTSAVNSAFLKKLQGSANYGAKKEALASSGLQSSGYAAHLNSKAASSFQSALSQLNGEKAESDAALRRSYSQYLDSFEKEREEIKASVKKTLLENRVLNTNAAYNYAINAGLDESEAEALASDVYSVIRPSVMTETLTKILDMELDLDGARAYARRMGLHDNDVRFVVASTEKIRKNYRKNFDDIFDYLRYLEEQSEKILG